MLTCLLLLIFGISSARIYQNIPRMEIEVRATSRAATDKVRKEVGNAISCCKNDCEDFNRTYGICVKFRPVKRSCSQPPRYRRTVEETIMEEPNLENSLSERDTEEDSAIGNSHSLRSEDLSILDVTPQANSDLTNCDCTGLTSVSQQQKGDLFDQLVLHFGNNKEDNCFPRGRTKNRNTPVRNKPFDIRRRRTFSAQHTIARTRRSRGLDSSTSLSSSRTSTVSRQTATSLVNSCRCKHQTSTPESSASNFEQISSDSNLGVSRIRALSTSSVEQSNNDITDTRINFDSTATVSEFNEDSSSTSAVSFALSNPPNKIIRIKSNRTVEELSEKRKSTPVFSSSKNNKMLRSHHQRSMTPDITSQRASRRDNYYNQTLNGLLSPSDSRGSLDRVTADSIDRRRSRQRAHDKFNDTIQGVGQLSTSNLPPRSRSALGDLSRDSDVWSTSSLHGTDSVAKNTNDMPTPVGFYLDKNGRVRQVRNQSLNTGPPSLPPDWFPDREAPMRSVESTDGRSVSEFSDKQMEISVPDVARSTPSCDSDKLHSNTNRNTSSQSALDIALNEDHDSIRRLAQLGDQDFTMKLISAMTELKDIAEVARIIDEVDDEEWLLVFIGELDHRLHYLMKLHEEGDEQPEDIEANIQERATILDVALDLISFLKDRSAYRIHRRFSLVENIDGAPRDNGDVILEDGNTTIQRMKKMVAKDPPNFWEMQKWQRQLMNLAGTLDKYLSVLQKEKENTPKLHNNDVIDDVRAGQHDEEVQDYQDALSEFSADHSGRHHSHTTSSISIGSTGDSNKMRSPEPYSNPNTNNNNSNVITQGPWRLPVLDLRDTASDCILNHIGSAAYVQDTRQILSPNSIDGEQFLNQFKDDNAPMTNQVGGTLPRNYKDSRSLPTSSRTSPSKAVVSAYCRFSTDSRRRSASISNVSDLKKKDSKRHVSELRMNIGGESRGRGQVSSGSSARRARSVDTSKQLQSTSPSYSPSPQSSENFSATSVCNGGSRSTGGARPKVRQPPLHRGGDTHSESSSSSDLGYQRRAPRIVTSSLGTQCDLDFNVKQREKNAEDKLKQLKRRVDLLKTGLDEAYQDRDEKERKISVLQARLDRMKKNLVTGESEKGAVEEDMDRLKKLLKEKTSETEEEIEVLQKRLEELDKQLLKEKEKYEKMSGTVEDLEQQLHESQEQCEEILKGKKELEQQIHDLTMALMLERQHNAQLQQENMKLEEQLEEANIKIDENEAENSRAQQQLQTLNSDLQEQLNQQRHLEEESSRGRFVAEERAAELEHDLEKAEHKIEELNGENQKLNNEKQELVQALANEQMMSKDLANCYMGQVEYLNHELKVNEERRTTQAEEYNREISRLLSEGAKKDTESDGIDSKAREEAEREKQRAEELERENERLRDEFEQIKQEKEAQKLEKAGKVLTAEAGTSTTEETSVQATDMSYTRMRAFDWYSSEAYRDARRLTERGRQLELETRARMRAARDAMHQLNTSLARERPETLRALNRMSPRKR